MTEQIVQNNYKIIADLKTYAKELRALTNIEDITEKMSHIRYYISTHRLLEEEFEKKYDNYEGTCFTSEGESYKDILDKVIKSELTKSFEEFNDSEYFYFPAFVETFDKFGMKKGLYAFYEFYGRANWSKILEKTGHAKEIKTLMENFCFYFVSLISIDVKLYEGLTDCHYRRYNFESFNLNYIYSIINGVLDYFQDLIYKNPDVDYSIKSNSTANNTLQQKTEILPAENNNESLINTSDLFIGLPQELQEATKQEKTVFHIFYENPQYSAAKVGTMLNSKVSGSRVYRLVESICLRFGRQNGNLGELREIINKLKNNKLNHV